MVASRKAKAARESAKDVYAGKHPDEKPCKRAKEALGPIDKGDLVRVESLTDTTAILTYAANGLVRDDEGNDVDRKVHRTMAVTRGDYEANFGNTTKRLENADA